MIFCFKSFTSHLLFTKFNFMTKSKLAISLLILGFSNYSFSQCAPGIAGSILDVNNVTARINSGGDMWWDNVSSPKYEVPKNSGLNVFFANTLWIGGIGTSGDLKLAAQMYRSGGVDYFPGYLDENGEVNMNGCLTMDRLFPIYKTEVEQFLLDGIPSTNILNWPGSGNPHLQLPIQDLAPFYDVNSDGIYDPTTGDYPKFKGDQAIWWVFNDNGNIHFESGGAAIGIEVQVMAYAYKEDGIVNNSTYYDYKIINKKHDISSAYVGIFTDADLGNPMDDYLVSFPNHNAAACYNGDANDESFGSYVGYGSNPPQATIQLNNASKNNVQPLNMTSFVSFSNSPSNISPFGMPNTALGYYNYLSGNNLQAIPLQTNAPLQTSGINYPFMHAADSVSFGNTESDLQLAPGDRKMIQSMEVGNFNQGDVIEFTVSALYARHLNGCANFDCFINDLSESQTFIEAYDTACAQPINYTVVSDVTNGTAEVVTNDSLDLLWSTGATSNEVFNLPADTYQVVISDASNCFIVEDIFLGVPNGIKQVRQEYFKAFPNPSEGTINVAYAGLNFNLDIYGVTGQLISSMQVQESTQIHFDTPGVYLLKMRSDQGVLTQKIIIE